MTHDRARMFLTSGDPPPDGPDDADLENPDYKPYLAYIALQIGVTGGAKTQSTTEPGYKRYFKTQFRTYQKDSKNPKLPSFEHWCATLKTGVADFAPEADFGTDNQSSVPDPNHKYAVTFPPDDIGPALMALLSTHALPDAGAVAMAISAAKPETVGTMVQDAFGYDMTDMFADFPTDAFDVAAWSKFVFLVSGGLVSSHLAIRHLASYMRTASADAGEARAGMLKKCMAAAAGYFTRENIPRAVQELESPPGGHLASSRHAARKDHDDHRRAAPGDLREHGLVRPQQPAHCRRRPVRGHRACPPGEHGHQTRRRLLHGVQRRLGGAVLRHRGAAPGRHVHTGPHRAGGQCRLRLVSLF